MVFKYDTFLVENKLWYKTISEFLSWLNSKSNKDFIFIDTETTGLGGSKIEQLTQISAISTNYNYNSNTFTENDFFNQKIKLTDEIKLKMNEPNSEIRKILGFNHYGDGKNKYYDEKSILIKFYDWINIHNDPIFVIQNASFDMDMLNGRLPQLKFMNEILDTKMIIQLYYIPLLQKLSETDDYYKNILNKIGTSTRDNGLISSSMGKIGPSLNLDMTNYHDALKDCEITINMFTKIIDKLKENKDVDIMKYQSMRIKSILKK